MDRTYNLMAATFHPAKELENVKAHGLTFEGVEEIFGDPIYVYEDNREDYGEQRWNVIGWLKGTLVHLTYRDDGDDIHAISLRNAEPHERRIYQEAQEGNL